MYKMWPTCSFNLSTSSPSRPASQSWKMRTFRNVSKWTCMAISACNLAGSCWRTWKISNDFIYLYYEILTSSPLFACLFVHKYSNHLITRFCSSPPTFLKAMYCFIPSMRFWNSVRAADMFEIMLKLCFVSKYFLFKHLQNEYFTCRHFRQLLRRWERQS
jgi:hypothetical protein